MVLWPLGVLCRTGQVRILECGLQDGSLRVREAGDWPKATQESSGKNLSQQPLSPPWSWGHQSQFWVPSTPTLHVCPVFLSQTAPACLNALPGQSPLYSAPPRSHLLSNSPISPIFLRSECIPQRLFLGHTAIECLLQQGEEEPAKVLTALGAMEV